MSVVLYHDYTYFAIKQISSFSSSCKSVKHRLHFSEVECSHCFSSSARSLFSQDKNRNFRLQPDSSAAQTRPSNAPPPRHADILQVGAILEYRRVRAYCFRIHLSTLSRVVGSITPWCLSVWTHCPRLLSSASWRGQWRRTSRGLEKTPEGRLFSGGLPQKNQRTPAGN